MRTNISIFISDLINLVLGGIAFFLIARILLRLFNANPATPFVAFINDVSGFLILPFRGIFRQPTIEGTTLDISAIVALVIYAIIAYLVSALISTFARPVESIHTDLHH